MSRWTMRRELLQQKRNALRLLTLSGAIRPARLEPRYNGGNRTINGPQDHPSVPADYVCRAAIIFLGHRDPKQLWNGYVRRDGSSKGLTQPS